MGTVLQDLHGDLRLVGGRNSEHERAVLPDLLPMPLVPYLVFDPAGPLRREAEHHVKELPVLEDAEGVAQVRLPILPCAT